MYSVKTCFSLLRTLACREELYFCFIDFIFVLVHKSAKKDSYWPEYCSVKEFWKKSEHFFCSVNYFVEPVNLFVKSFNKWRFAFFVIYLDSCGFYLVQKILALECISVVLNLSAQSWDLPSRKMLLWTRVDKAEISHWFCQPCFSPVLIVWFFHPPEGSKSSHNI